MKSMPPDLCRDSARTHPQVKVPPWVSAHKPPARVPDAPTSRSPSSAGATCYPGATVQADVSTRAVPGGGLESWVRELQG